MRIVFWYFVWFYVCVIHLIIERNLIMPKYKTLVYETQYWVYEYETEAKDEDEAYRINRQKHDEGLQSDDSWIDETETTDNMTEEI